MRRLLTLILALFLLSLPVAAEAAKLWVYCGGLPGCKPGFIERLTPALGVLLTMLRIYIPIFGTLFIMVGGAYMVLSAGSSERVEKGKKTITWAIIGLFLALSAADLVSFVVLPEAQSFASAGSDPIFAVGTVLQKSLFYLLNVALLGVAVFCGMWMVLSIGKEDAFQKATSGLFWAAVGSIIINMAGLITNAFLT